MCEEVGPTRRAGVQRHSGHTSIPLSSLLLGVRALKMTLFIFKLNKYILIIHLSFSFSHCPLIYFTLNFLISKICVTLTLPSYI